MASNEIHVTNLPAKELDPFLKRMQSDSAFVYYGVFVPHGDTEGGRLRKLGLVQVYKRERPVRVREVDKTASRLLRKG